MRGTSTYLVSALLVFTFGCNNKVVPLQHTYQDKPYQFSTTLNKEQVIDKLVGSFVSQGLAIKLVDKSTGLITTDNTSFLNSYTYESKNDGLTNTNAFVVCSKVRGPFTFAPSIKPDNITGQWTVRATQQADKTVVDIMLANAAGKVVENTGSGVQPGSTETHNLVVRSTGVFEKSVEQSLK